LLQQQQQLQIQQQQMEIQMLQRQLQQSAMYGPPIPPQRPLLTNPQVAVHSQCIYGTPPITPQMSTQQALNVVEFVMRKAGLAHMGCAEYPKYCSEMKIARGTRVLH
jgi:hypothetical protein